MAKLAEATWQTGRILRTPSVQVLFGEFMELKSVMPKCWQDPNYEKNILTIFVTIFDFFSMGRKTDSELNNL